MPCPKEHLRIVASGLCRLHALPVSESMASKHRRTVKYTTELQAQEASLDVM